MILHAYADESCNDKAETLCGFIATPDYWKKFSRRWGGVLDDFAAPYFHFREFVGWDKKNNPYLGWSEKKRDSFINELAIVLSETAVPVGGVFNAAKFRAEKMEGDSWDILVRQFYYASALVIDDHWPGFKGEIHFVFDDTDNRDRLAVFQTVHAHAKTISKTVGGISFEDDKSCPPLQAADLFAYISRQVTEAYYEQDRQKQVKTHLHWILSKNHNSKFKKIHTPESWKKLVRLVLNHRKEMRDLWAKQGIKRRYIPELDFRPVAEKLGIPFVDTDKM